MNNEQKRMFIVTKTTFLVNNEHTICFIVTITKFLINTEHKNKVYSNKD